MKTKSILLRVLIGAAAVFVAYWFALPALNLASKGFWFFLLFILAVVALLTVPTPAAFAVADYVNARVNGKGFKRRGERVANELGSRRLVLRICGIAAAAIVAFLLVGSLIGAHLFNAAAYRDLLPLADGDFAQDVAELQMSQIPVVDRDTASRLGSRKLGEMKDLVSQFDIEQDYTQINFGGVPTRVTPLAYADIIKWAYNQKNGLPGYLMVDMATQETTLVRFANGGMKYSRSDILTRDITRHLRFNYPTAIFDEISFEIDEDGTPYWVASVVRYRVGIWGGKDIKGAVLCNAITGKCDYYPIESVPQWVDQAYSTSMVLDQLTDHGAYIYGFWNSVFGQREVLQPTEGYNYVAVDDDVWVYTGMTSVVADESNVGFVLINLRTKEGRFYAVPGAEEYSAMASAEGQVQNLHYVSTFPILLNVADRPTYFMALKDSAGLSKMYAFVDVEHYQVVATGYTVDEARANYSAKLSSDESIETKETEVRGVIEAVSQAVIDGNTRYYLLLDGTVYRADIALSDRLPFVKAGDTVAFTADESGRIVAWLE